MGIYRGKSGKRRHCKRNVLIYLWILVTMMLGAARTRENVRAQAESREPGPEVYKAERARENLGTDN